MSRRPRTKKHRIVKRSKAATSVSVKLGDQDKTIERRRYLLQLIRRGITQPDKVVEMYAKQGYDISERTIRDDRKAVREALRADASIDVEDTRLELSEQLDDLALQFQQISQQALAPVEKKSYHAAVQALGQKKDVIVAKAKLTGAWVEKQEVTGAVTNMNLNTEATPEEMKAFVAALKQAGFDGASVVEAIRDAA
jgi:hypothetical protein